MKNSNELILKSVTVYMLLTMLYKTRDIYDMNRLKGYKELTNPHLTIEIDYTDYKELNIEELEKDIIEYIEYYNNRRIKSKLKGMSPVQYRQHSMLVA